MSTVSPSSSSEKPSGKASSTSTSATSRSAAGTRSVQRTSAGSTELSATAEAPQPAEEPLVGRLAVVGRRERTVELLDQLALVAVQAAWDDYVHQHPQAAAAPAADVGHALALQHPHLAGLRARLELQRRGAVERRDVERRAQGGLGDRQLDDRHQVAAGALEARIL